MLTHALELASRGLAVHWLYPKAKNPVGKDWSQKPVATVDELKSSYQAGYNIGVRPGKWSCVQGAYLHVVDFDVRDAKFERQARSALYSVFPELDLDTCPTAISGSGGASRHFHFFSDKPFEKRIIAKSESKTDGKHDWQIELYGTGSNLVLPPSIHPSGQPYRWLRGYDWDSIDLMGPEIIPSEVIERILGDTVDQTEIGNVEPLGLTAAEVADLLADKPNDDLDYDEWLNVMAAVQHECANRSKEEKDEFFMVFREWSSKSKKYDYNRTRYKFFSFKNTDNRKLRTMRSIAAEVREIRLERSLDAEFEDLGDDLSDQEFDDLGPDDDEIFGDLLGSETTKPKAKKTEKPIWESPLAPKYIRYLSKRHAILRFKAKTYIVDIDENPDEPYVAMGDEKGLLTLYKDRTEDITTIDKNTNKPKIVTKSWAELWLSSPYRRTYEKGICFNPLKDEPGRLNLWRGWSVEPSGRGSCDLLIKHIEQVLCRGNAVYAKAFLDFMAHMVQRPWERPSFALVMRGPMGAGKDTPFTYMSKFMGPHYLTIGRNEDLSGRFNGHLMGRILVHLQESFFAGDHKQRNYMKFLLSSERISIEKKGVDIVSVKALHRTVMSSNEDWVAPASWGERRYFVLDVDGKYANGSSDESSARNKAYFDAIANQMNNEGGIAKLLYMLLKRDISDFDVRRPPRTEALAEQITQGLPSVDRWWFDVLQAGCIDTTSNENTAVRSIWERGELRKPTDEIFDAFDRWRQHQRFRADSVSRQKFVMDIKRLCPGMVTKQVRVSTNDRARVAVIPPLRTARKEFDAMIGGGIKWDDDYADDMQEEDDLNG